MQLADVAKNSQDQSQYSSPCNIPQWLYQRTNREVFVEMHNQYVCHVDNWVQMSKMENSFFGCVSCEGEPFEEFIKKGQQVILCSNRRTSSESGVNVPQYGVYGESAKLSCKYTSMQPVYSVKWYKNGLEFFRQISDRGIFMDVELLFDGIP